jgi:hypothetical protein
VAQDSVEALRVGASLGAKAMGFRRRTFGDALDEVVMHEFGACDQPLI